MLFKISFQDCRIKRSFVALGGAFLFSLWPLASHLPGTALVRAEAPVGDGDLFFVVRFESKLCQLHFSKLS